MSESRRIDINVPVLARVEGEGALELAIEGDVIRELRLRIFEPPRLFEKFLEGREPQELIDMVARICGICPVAYQMSAVQAIEASAGVDALTGPAPWVRDMRRLFYCGEWIQSHALHIHLLAAPDFLGFDSATEMARDYPDEVRRGLRLQGLGNALISLLGGRSVHPVGVRPGGFHRAPDAVSVAALLPKIEAGYQEGLELIEWLATLALPVDEQDFVSVALAHPGEYAMYAGRIRSSTGLDIDIAEYPQHLDEFQVPHSTALHASLHGGPYLVGPLARLNLSHAQLPGELLAMVERIGLRLPSRNMFHSVLARAFEMTLALGEAAALLRTYAEPLRSAVDLRASAGIAFGATEAPRGLLWHRYEFDERGWVKQARIVPPTSQNQARIEQDIATSLTAFGLHRDEESLRLRAETVIRNYDPCISCATHFLTLKVDRQI